MIGIGIGVTYRWQSQSGEIPIPQSQPWFLAGDGTALDIVVDTSVSEGLSLDGAGDVASILNLGKAAGVTFLPSGATNSPVTTVAGRTAIQFDGGSALQPYRGGASYAAGAFASTRCFFMMHAVTQYTTSGDQVALSAGETGSGSPRINLTLKGNGSTNTFEHHNGSTSRTVQGPLDRVAGDVTVQAGFHDGVSEASLWSNGAVLALRDPQTTMVTDAAPVTDILSIGGLANGVWDLKGDVLGAAMDNTASLSHDAAFAKYKAACTHFGRTGRPAFAIWSLGQSNAQADFPNPAPLSFAPEAGYYRQRTGGYNQVLRRDAFAHGATSVGASSPAVYFADEWVKLTAQAPVFQELAFSGQPITPGLTGKSNYWAPQNAEGDAAGDISLMETWKDDFRRFSDLLKYSPEFDLQHNIALIIEGEADAVGFTSGDNVTIPRLVGFMNAWLDEMASTYGIQTFAIANIGRSGNSEAAVAANAAGVTTVRSAWSQVIAARSDAYDVFAHSNHMPQPFVMDDLVVDTDGAWVSGAGYQSDGVHYTTPMYQALGRTAARNLYAQLGL